ncbi:hypothetical protein DIPPA_23486 [Diplonema papillatum]|nr:hypothetical protein DIPPA_23486 [Diplonema papillatum]
MDWEHAKDAAVRHSNVWVDTILFCFVSILLRRVWRANRFDREMTVGFWHRQSGWRETLNEWLTVAWWALLWFGCKERSLVDPTNLLTLAAAVLYTVPKLPPTEVIYDFLLHNALWVCVLCEAAAVFFPEEAGAATPTASAQRLALAVFPFKTVLMSDMALKRKSGAAAVVNGVHAVLFLAMPAAIVAAVEDPAAGGAPPLVEAALRRAELPPVAAAAARRLHRWAAAAAAAALCFACASLWQAVFDAATRRYVLAQQEKERDEAAFAGGGGGGGSAGPVRRRKGKK